MGNNFCPGCGNRLEEGQQFCPNCGTARAKPAAPRSAPEPEIAYTPQPPTPAYTPYSPQPTAPAYTPYPTQPTAPAYTPYPTQPTTPAGYAMPAPGYSRRANDPEILAAVKKQNKAANKFLVILLLLPLFGLPVYALITGEMELGEALTLGAVVSLVILVFNLISKAKTKPNKSYDAEVIDKRIDERNDDNGSSTEYLTICRTTAGKKKTIRENSAPDRSAYKYLEVGDRFRYHANFPFPYEKYDKARDGFVYCPVCAAQNALTEDRCTSCGLPLLK